MAQWYYVGAPITGSINALRWYCGTSVPHPITAPGFSDPIDIGNGSPGLQRIDFFGSSNIGSIYVRTYYNSVCLPPSPGSPWADRLQVDMFTGPWATGIWIGSVNYSHVQYPIADGVYNTYYGPLAWVPDYCPGCGCYQGRHSHIERFGGYTYVGLDWGNNGTCGYFIGAGTVIYGWYV
jgi:hypothetical protein